MNMSIFLQVKKLWSDLKHFQVKGCVFLLLCVVRRTTVKRKKKKKRFEHLTFSSAVLQVRAFAFVAQC